MDHTRHMNIYQIPDSFSVSLIGAGGIGATTALALAKMGVRALIVFDDDEISDVNLPTQLHRISDVGNQKVLSLETTLHEFSDELDFFPRPYRVTETETIRSSLVVSAVDSITARQDIWRALNNGSSAWDFYLDSRMAAEEYQHFLVNAQDEKAVAAYEAKLMAMDESSAPSLPCTAKATFHCAMAAAAHIGTQVRNIVRGEARSHRLVHDIPANWLETFPV